MSFNYVLLVVAFALLCQGLDYGVFKFVEPADGPYPAGSNVKLSWLYSGIGVGSRQVDIIFIDVAAWTVDSGWGSFTSPTTQPLPYRLRCNR